MLARVRRTAGSSRRAQFLTFAATLVAGFALQAGVANAASLHVSPSIQGPGFISGVSQSYFCGGPQDDGIVGCGGIVIDSGIFGGSVGLTLRAIPASNAN